MTPGGAKDRDLQIDVSLAADLSVTPDPPAAFNSISRDCFHVVFGMPPFRLPPLAGIGQFIFYLTRIKVGWLQLWLVTFYLLAKMTAKLFSVVKCSAEASCTPTYTITYNVVTLVNLF